MQTQQKILVVDDDPVVSQSFKRVLATKGYAVISASSGAEALDKLSKEEYDAVFTDLKMPGMGGLEVAEKVKASQPWMPVVIVTGYGSDAYEKQASDLGVDQFLRKPLSPDMIELATDKAMHQKRLAQIYTLPTAFNVSQPVAVVQKSRSHLTNVALFLASPFVGLVYVAAMPFAGVGAIAYFGFKAAMKVTAIKHVAMAIAAPFIGLAAIVAAPFIGLGALVYFGGKSLSK